MYPMGTKKKIDITYASFKILKYLPAVILLRSAPAFLNPPNHLYVGADGDVSLREDFSCSSPDFTGARKNTP